MPKTFEATRKALNELAEKTRVRLSVWAMDDTKPGDISRWERWDASVEITAEEIKIESEAPTGEILLKKIKAELKAARAAKAAPKRITHQPKRLEHHVERASQNGGANR